MFLLSHHTYLEKQAETHPLVVLVHFAIVVLPLGITDARVRHLGADLLQEQALERVRRMDPAICVEDVLWNVFGVHTVDRIADILARRDDQRERHQHHDSDRVVQPEHGRIDVHMADLDEILKATEYVEHRETAASSLMMMAAVRRT